MVNLGNCTGSPQPRCQLKLPPNAILAPTRSILSCLNQAIEIEDSQLRQRGLLADAIPVACSSNYTVVGPVLGSAAAVTCSELLFSTGTKQLVLLGLTGALAAANDSIRIGDIIFPRGYLSEEGTSSLYGQSQRGAVELSQLQLRLERELKQIADSSISIFQGSIWSTDAPYRESSAKVAAFCREGAIAVEMEYSAVHAVCMEKKVEFAAVFVVSDLVGETWQPGFSKIKNHPSLMLAAKATLGALATGS